jgi:RNA polymerase sigma factor (sigma-70 family)
MPGLQENPIRIVILDYHTLMRGGLHLLIEKQSGMEVVGEAGSLTEGLEIIARLNPDIILLELNLADNPPCEIVTSLLNSSRNSHVILVTGIVDTEVLHQVVEAGAMGVVLKSQPPESLIKAIQKVNAGEVWLERSLIANVLHRRSRNQARSQSDIERDSIDELSEREKQVIRLIGQGFKNKKISDQLCISETTVRHHLSSIYKKLGVNDRLELLVFAHRLGLVTTPNK